MTARSYFSDFFTDLFTDFRCSGRRLFFLHGMWRSGTTWVGRMLGDHPDIYICQHELQTYQKGFSVSLSDGPLEEHAFLAERFHLSRKAGFLSLLQHLHETTKPGAQMVGDRSPGADVLRMQEDFPAARSVVVLRDGRDVCVSAAHLASRAEPTRHIEFLRAEQNGVMRLADWFIQASAVKYADYMNDYFELAERSPDDVLLVRYEDLHADCAGTMGKIFAFLGVVLGDEEVAAICKRHTFKKESSREPGEEDVGAYMRKGVIGDWQRYFSDTGIASYEALAGHALRKAGYDLAAADEPPVGTVAVQNVEPSIHSGRGHRR